MNVIEKRVADLKPYGKNPRKNDDAVQYVAESIRQFGWKVPIVIDRNNEIVCGHTRWKAAKKLKLDSVPCVVADDLTEEQIRAYRLADNRVAEKAEWDLALLDTELAEIETIDMTLLGFDDKEETPQEGGASVNTSNTSFSYQEQYGVIVMCKNEQEQEAIFNRLTEEGYECKVVAV